MLILNASPTRFTIHRTTTNTDCDELIEIARRGHAVRCSELLHGIEPRVMLGVWQLFKFRYPDNSALRHFSASTFSLCILTMPPDQATPDQAASLASKVSQRTNPVDMRALRPVSLDNERSRA